MNNAQEENLEKLVRQRKQEAEDKQIDYKLRTIVDILGYSRGSHSTETIGSTGIYTTIKKGTYNDAEFSIKYEIESGESSDGGGGSSSEWSIYYNKSQVYLAYSLTLEVYIPGTWEESFNRLYEKAHAMEVEKKKETLEKQKKSALEAKDETMKKLRKNFGL